MNCLPLPRSGRSSFLSLALDHPRVDGDESRTKDKEPSEEGWINQIAENKLT